MLVSISQGLKDLNTVFRILVFNQSSPVNPVSDYKGGGGEEP